MQHTPGTVVERVKYSAAVRRNLSSNFGAGQVMVQSLCRNTGSFVHPALPEESLKPLVPFSTWGLSEENQIPHKEKQIPHNENQIPRKENQIPQKENQIPHKEMRK